MLLVNPPYLLWNLESGIYRRVGYNKVWITSTLILDYPGGRRLCSVRLRGALKFAYSLHDASIGIGTLVIRTLTVPVAIYNQRNAGQMQLHMPKLQELQGRLQEARIRNDQLASEKIILPDYHHRCSSTALWFCLVMRAGSDLMEFMKYSDVKPWKAMIGPFMQVSVGWLFPDSNAIFVSSRCLSSFHSFLVFVVWQITLSRAWCSVELYGFLTWLYPTRITFYLSSLQWRCSSPWR